MHFLYVKCLLRLVNGVEGPASCILLILKTEEDQLIWLKRWLSYTLIPQFFNTLYFSATKVNYTVHDCVLDLCDISPYSIDNRISRNLFIYGFDQFKTYSYLMEWLRTMTDLGPFPHIWVGMPFPSASFSICNKGQYSLTISLRVHTQDQINWEISMMLNQCDSNIF